jgi:hypothetical protein
VKLILLEYSIELVFSEIGILIKWVGSGVDEIGINILSGDTC